MQSSIKINCWNSIIEASYVRENDFLNNLKKLNSFQKEIKGSECFITCQFLRKLLSLIKDDWVKKYKIVIGYFLNDNNKILHFWLEGPNDFYFDICEFRRGKYKLFKLTEDINDKILEDDNFVCYSNIKELRNAYNNLDEYILPAYDFYVLFVKLMIGKKLLTT